MAHVGSGTVLTLVVPLALLVVILGVWALEYRRTQARRRRRDAS